MPSPTSCLALLALCLALAPRAGALTTTGQYVVKNTGRAGCSGQLLGFNNRTCSAGTNTLPAGPGVGPSLRAETAANAWATFTVTVTKELPGGAVEAVLSTFAAPDGPQPRCMGNLVAEKAAACADPRTHIHPAAQAGAGVPWVLTPVGGGAAFTIAYTGRAEGCATHLTASAACGTSAPFLAAFEDGAELQEWVLEPLQEPASPSPSPSPPPPPLAGQPPSVAVTNVGAASAFVTVTPPAAGCAPVSYVVSHAPANSLAPPSRTKIPDGGLTAALGNLQVDVTYIVTAVGTCADGTKTPPSAPARFTTFDNCPTAAVAANCQACKDCFSQTDTVNATCCPGRVVNVDDLGSGFDCDTYNPVNNTAPVFATCEECRAPCEACDACGGTFIQYSCFPGDAMVSTPGGGAARMDALRVGDRVLAARPDGSLFFDEIYIFGHKDAAPLSTFVQLATAGGAALRLTADHHVYVTRAGARLDIPASAAQVGDLVHVAGADGAATLEAIVSKSLVRARGLFTPYTLSGSIVVDGVAASCHASWVLDGAFSALGVPLTAGYQAAFAPLRALYRLLGARRMAALQPIVDAAVVASNKQPAAVLAPLVASTCALGAAAWVAARKRAA